MNTGILVPILWLHDYFRGESTSGDETPFEKDKIRYQSLLPDQQELYAKIARDLIECVRINPNKTHFSVTFRKRESWATVDELFRQFLTGSKCSSGDKKWVNDWQLNISLLRVQQKTLVAIAEKIVKIRSQTPPDQNALGILHDMLDETRAEIRKIVKDLSDKLQRDVQDTDRIESADDVVQFVNDNWPRLTLFLEWSTVPIDAAHVFARVKPWNANTKLTSIADIALFRIKVVQKPGTSPQFVIEDEDIPSPPSSPRGNQKDKSSEIGITDKNSIHHAFSNRQVFVSPDVQECSSGESIQRMVHWIVDALNERASVQLAGAAKTNQAVLPYLNG